MVLKGGAWVQELQPDSRFRGVLIRDEYKEALRAIMEWFLHEKQVTDDAVTDNAVTDNAVTDDAMEVDDEPAPFGNPFLDIPTSHVSENWAFIILGNPGIGG
jgi:hypothetical protein